MRSKISDQRSKRASWADRRDSQIIFKNAAFPKNCKKVENLELAEITVVSL